MRSRIAATLILASFATLLVGPPAAQALCAADPDALTFRQMIKQGTTGQEGYPVMILGAVVTIKDLGGRPGSGAAIAKLAVAAHPVGSAPLVSRVHFLRPAPNVGVEDNLEFHPGKRYVVIASPRPDGSFDPDGGCGQTRAVTALRFRRLVALAKEQTLAAGSIGR